MLLLRLADRYLHAPLWSADILAEWMRSLLADRPDIETAVLARTRMDGHFSEALVKGYEPITVKLDLPGPDDRHVLAAATRRPGSGSGAGSGKPQGRLGSSTPAPP